MSRVLDFLAPLLPLAILAVPFVVSSLSAYRWATETFLTAVGATYVPPVGGLWALSVALYRVRRTRKPDPSKP